MTDLYSVSERFHIQGFAMENVLARLHPVPDTFSHGDFAWYQQSMAIAMQYSTRMAKDLSTIQSHCQIIKDKKDMTILTERNSSLTTKLGEINSLLLARWPTGFRYEWIRQHCQPPPFSPHTSETQTEAAQHPTSMYTPTQRHIRQK